MTYLEPDNPEIDPPPGALALGFALLVLALLMLLSEPQSWYATR